MAKLLPTYFSDSVKARFWSKVDVRGPDECWEWQTFTCRKGYGRFWMNHETFRAHRIALAIHTSTSPRENEFACHSCDNPKCCNPLHLRWATHEENMRDARERGRLWGKGAKKFCKRGHEQTPENKRPEKGKRLGRCKICYAIDKKAQLEKYHADRRAQGFPPRAFKGRALRGQEQHAG